MESKNGTLPQNVPLGMTYVPMQQAERRYSNEIAIQRGTIYPDLDFPFQNYTIKENLSKTPLHELMELDFVCWDLGLYLDTHPNDSKACEYYNQHIQMCCEARRLYIEKCGPLLKSDGYKGKNSWICDPWPWDIQ